MSNPNAWLGYRRDTRDPRDLLFRPRKLKLPSKVDLRPDLPAVLNQGSLGSCVINATSVALRYALKMQFQAAPALSRLQGYYDVRKLQGTLDEDSGCEIRLAIKCANKIGIGRESLWPYRIRQFTDAPPPAVYQDAIHFNAMKYKRVAVNASHIKAALAQNLPVIIGVTLFESFDSKSVERTGVVPMPDTRKESILGGHAMLVVGYGQKAGHFTVRNSWGRDWGHSGDCYLPEKYVGSTRFGGDYWVVSLVG